MSERARRWRLALGADAQEALGEGLGPDDQARDQALAALYGGETPEGDGADGAPRGAPGRRRGALGRSTPRVARWLGDIRRYFPSSVVQVMQRDAMERLGLRELLVQPEMLAAVQPDVHLVATLLALRDVLPDESRETARAVVRTVTDELEARLAAPLEQAVRGALYRGARSRRPRLADVDWNRTVLANLKHYQPEARTIVPERLIGYARRGPQVPREIILAIDQSGSMATSVVYASVFGAVLASLRSLRTQVVAFDTEVVDLTEHVHDPAELLFGVQLGGGTDINRALAYCETLVTRQRDTVLVLVSDLVEGGLADETVARVRALVQSGVTVVALLALSDDGAPTYDHDLAAAFAEAGAPAFACTPDRFADLMATAIQHGDVARFAEEQLLSQMARSALSEQR